MTHVPETGTENRYQKMVPVFQCKFFVPVASGIRISGIPETNMADDTVAVAAVGILVATVAKEKENRKRKRTIWMQPWIANRETHGTYHALLQELDDKSYINFLHMYWGSFEMLLHKWHRIFSVRTLRCD